MRLVLTAAEMREADRRTTQQIGLPGAVLMENAGAAVARAVRERFPEARSVSVLCGKGNNGGDGFVAARWLIGLSPVCYLSGRCDELTGDARLHAEAWLRSGGVVRELVDGDDWDRVAPQALTADVVIDALLGTGLNRQPSGLIGRMVASLGQRSRGVLAVDLPSGLPSDDGAVSWASVAAEVTVTFAAPKRGHVLSPSCDRVGELIVAPIGIPDEVLGAVQAEPFGLLDREDALGAFPPREAGAHKGRFGHLLIVGGNVGKTGAAVLAAAGALRSGAGLVTVAAPAEAVAAIASGRAEAMTEPLPAEGGGLGAAAAARVIELASTRDAVVLGPGLGLEGPTLEFVREVVARCPVPLVLDADGLNAAARVGAAALLRSRSLPTVLTPHPGEMARLCGVSIREIQADRVAAARQLARDSGSVVVLKGQRTIVASPGAGDIVETAVNPTGNAGMATGGTGDVLAGIIGALLARGHTAVVAARAGVFVHGLAGDIAATHLGEESLLAGDVVDALHEAIARLGPTA